MLIDLTLSESGKFGNMNTRIIALTLIILSLIISSSFAVQSDNSPVLKLTLKEKASIIEGMHLFRKHCGSCHGSNARGGRGPDLTDGRWAYGNSDDEIFTSISEGRSASHMPQMKGRLTEDEIRKIISFLRALEERA
jgi:cytochrome c oxidase cbb3-type subunit 3